MSVIPYEVIARYLQPRIFENLDDAVKVYKQYVAILRRYYTCEEQKNVAVFTTICRDNRGKTAAVASIELIKKYIRNIRTGEFILISDKIYYYVHVDFYPFRIPGSS